MTALILAAILAAPGDAEYVFTSRVAILSAPQRTALNTFATGILPTFALASTLRLYCGRDVNGCLLEEQATITAAQYISALDAGMEPTMVSAAGGNVTVVRRRRGEFAAGDMARLNTYLAAAHPGATVPLSLDLACERSGSDWACTVNHQKTAAPATFVTDMVASNVVRFIRRVP